MSLLAFKYKTERRIAKGKVDKALNIASKDPRVLEALLELVQEDSAILPKISGKLDLYPEVKDAVETELATSSPTPVPTPSPTPVPTPSPTPSPTPAPAPDFTQDEVAKIVKAQFLFEKHDSIISQIQAAKDDSSKKTIENAGEICKEMKVNSEIDQESVKVTYAKVFDGDSVGKFYKSCSDAKKFKTFFVKSEDALDRINTNAEDAEKLADGFAKCEEGTHCAKNLIEERGFCNDGSLFGNTTDCKYLAGDLNTDTA